MTASTVTVCQRRLRRGWVRRVMRIAWVAWEVEAGDGGDLQAADLDPAVAAVAGVVGDGDVWPRQGAELVVQRGLVALDDQQVGGALSWVTGQSACSRWGWSASAVTTVTARSGRSSSGRNRVISLVVAAAAQGLAVDRDRPPGRPGW